MAERARRLLSRRDGAAHRDAARAIAEEIAAVPASQDVARRLPDHA